MNLYKGFNKLPIKRQIQIAVSGMSICLCQLVFILLTINLFILLNISYTDALTQFENQENDSLEQIFSFIDEAASANVDLTQIGTQRLRNFLELNKYNQNFLDQITISEKVHSRMILDGSNETQETIQKACPNALDCMVYKTFSTENKANDPLFSFYMKFAVIALPLLNATLDTRFQNQFAAKVYHKIQFYSTEIDTMFFYPASQFNPGFQQAQYRNWNKRIAGETYANFHQKVLAYESNDVSSSSEMDYIYANNPYLLFTPNLQEIQFPYFRTNLTTPAIVSTISLKYQPNTTSATLKNESQIIDAVFSDWSSSTLELIALRILNEFPGIKGLIGNIQENTVTPLLCHYLIKRFLLQNNDTLYTGKGQNITLMDGCFPYTPAKQKFNEYFSFLLNSNLKRKAKIDLFNEYQENNRTAESYFYLTNRDQKWKLFISKIPEIGTKYVIVSNFIINFECVIVLMKNLNYTYTYYNDLFLKYLGVFFFVVFYVLIIWYVILIILLVISVKVTREILDPINKIISHVSCFNMDNTSQQIAIQEVKKITYPYDSDIDDMFQICKNILLGGFREVEEDELKLNQKRNNYLNSMNRAYNNISYIKSNNLIIKDDESLLNRCDNIFGYAQDSFEIKTESKLEGVETEDNCVLEMQGHAACMIKKVAIKTSKADIKVSEMIPEDEVKNQMISYVKNRESRFEKSDLKALFMSSTNEGRSLNMVKLNIRK